MSHHLRPPERKTARRVGALAIAVGISLLAVAGLSMRPDEQGDGDRAQPPTSTTETVLGEVVERTTLPDAPPASAVAVTTTTASASDEDPPSVNPGTAPQTPQPPETTPTIGPPVSITRPPTTTSSTTSTTSTTASTTSTTPTTTGTGG